VNRIGRVEVKNQLKLTLNLQELESHLWESANILRGAVDAADFKTYVFPDRVRPLSVNIRTFFGQSQKNRDR